MQLCCTFNTFAIYRHIRIKTSIPHTQTHCKHYRQYLPVFMRRRTILVFWIIFSLSSMLYAQSDRTSSGDSCIYHFEGYVRDIRSKQPLPFATVQIEGTNKGAVADERGHFSFDNLCQNEFDVVVSNVGYKQAVHHHDPYHDMPNIFLASDSITLQSITIEGKAQPGQLFSGTVESLSSDEIEKYHAQNLGDLVSNITGVSMLSTGQNVVKPIIHGLHSNRILIINNGVRHEFQSWGEEHAPEIDVSLIDHISVVKGAATVRYGPEALGGVLLINPPPMDLRTEWQGNVGFTGKSNGRSGESSFQLQKGYRRVALLAQASYLIQGDLQTPDYILSNTGKRESSIGLGGRYHWRRLDFSAYYSHFAQNLGILRGSITGNLDDLVYAMEREQPQPTFPFTYAINNPHQEVQHDMIKLNGRWNGENQSVEVQYAYQVNNRQEYDVRRGNNNELPSIDLILSSQTLDIDWKHPDFGKWQGNAGVQGLYQVNQNQPGTNTVPFIPNFDNSRIGLYIIEARSFGTNRLEVGARYDYQYSAIRGRKPDNVIFRNEISYQNVTATIGLVHEIKEGQTFRTNIGTAWRPPNISELYSYGKHGASYEYGIWRYTLGENNAISTQEVLSQSEKPVFSEVGLKWIGTYEVTSDKMQSEVTAYANYIQNYMYTRPFGITNTIRGALPYFIYDQDDALLAGVDASIMLMHTSELSSTLKGSYLWAKNISKDDYFVGMPPAKLAYQLSKQWQKFAFFDQSSVDLSLSYTFRQFQAPRVISAGTILEAERNNENIFAENDAIFDYMPAPSAYFLGNLSWSGQVNHIALSLQIKNILNKTYRSYTNRLRYFADETGRNFVVSVKYFL